MKSLTYLPVASILFFGVSACNNQKDANGKTKVDDNEEFKSKDANEK